MDDSIIQEKMRCMIIAEANLRTAKRQNLTLNITAAALTVLTTFALVVAWKIGMVGIFGTAILIAATIGAYAMPRKSVYLLQADFAVAKNEYDRALYKQAQETLDSFGKEK